MIERPDLGLLESIQREVLNKINQSEEFKKHSFSQPLLIWPSPNYLNAKIRLMIVGQETKGWEKESESASNSYEHLIDGYQRFNYSKEYGRTPFWRSAHILRQTLLGENSSWDAMINSNVFPVDQQGRQPEQTFHDLLRSFGLLRGQVQAMKPHVLVFLTGKRYDYSIKGLFPDCNIQSPAQGMTVIDLSAYGVEQAYRVYHPGYARRRGMEQAQIDWIVGQYNCSKVSGSYG